MFSSRQWRKGLRMDSAVLKENKQTKPTQLQQHNNKTKTKQNNQNQT